MHEEQALHAAEEPDGFDDRDAGAGSVFRVVAFFLAGQRYALPLERVREIQQIVAFSDTPAGGSAVVGMVNLRGTVIPAVDVRLLVGVEPAEYTLETPMIIALAHDEAVALVVDEVQDVIEIPDECWQDTPTLHPLASMMQGVCRMPDGLVSILDIDLLLPLDRFKGVDS